MNALKNFITKNGFKLMTCVLWGFTIMTLSLETWVLLQVSKCDSMGDRYGVAADYHKSQCHLYIDDQWVSETNLTFTATLKD